MPTGGKAVTKGSFTAWTVPKDPKPGQDYKIVIQIKVPETVKRYRIADLSGRVIGTDKYTLDIPYENQFNRYGTKIQKSLRSDKLEFVKRGDYARIVDSQVQVIVNVEGAKQLVQKLAQEYNIELDLPWNFLPGKIILVGTKKDDND